MSSVVRDEIPTPPPHRGGGRWLAALVLVVVAFVGVAGGVALDRQVLLHGHRFGADRQRPGFPGGRGLHRMRDQLADSLALTPAQRQRMDSVMDRQLTEFRNVRQRVQPQMDSIVAATRRAMDSLLTPEQRQKLEHMRQARAFGPPFPGMERRRDAGPPPPR